MTRCTAKAYFTECCYESLLARPLLAAFSLSMVSPKNVVRVLLSSALGGVLCAAGCSPDSGDPDCCPRRSDELVEYAPWDLRYQTGAGEIRFTEDDRMFEYYFRNVTTGAGVRYEAARMRELDEDRLTFLLTLRTDALLPAGEYEGRFEKSAERVDMYCYDYYPYTLYLEKVSATTRAHWIGHGGGCY